MKKTLYYDIIFRKVGKMYNEGFLIVDIEDERILSIEGVLTCGYIKAEMEGNCLVMQYYTLDSLTQTLMEEFLIFIPKEKLEIPFNIKTLSVDGSLIEIKTTNKVSDDAIQSKYDRKLKRFKRDNVFQ